MNSLILKAIHLYEKKFYSKRKNKDNNNTFITNPFKITNVNLEKESFCSPKSRNSSAKEREDVTSLDKSVSFYHFT